MQFECGACGGTVEASSVFAHYNAAHPDRAGKGARGRERAERSDVGPPSGEPTGGAAPAGGPAADQGELFHPDERPPALPADLEPPPEPTAGGRLRRLLSGWKASSGPAVSGRERRPSRRREPAVDLLAGAWSGLGWMAGQVDGPVGRTMQLQAPVAGEVFDAFVAGTWADRTLVQPVARNTEAAKAAGAVLALPALVFMYERANPELRPVIGAWMEQAALAHLVAMAPVVKRKRARDRELAKVVEDLKAEGLLDEKIGTATDAARMMLDQIFGPAPEPAPNGQAPAEPEGVRV